MVSGLVMVAKVTIWATSYIASPEPDKIDEAGQLIVEAATPMGVDALQTLSNLGFIGGSIGVAFIVIVILASKR